MIFDRLAKLRSREKVALAVGLLVVAAVFVDRLVVQRVVDTVNRLGDELAIQKKNLGLQRRVLSSKDEIDAEYERLREVVLAAESQAIAIDEMKGQIDGLARETRIRLDSWEERTPRQVRDDLPFEEYSVAIRQFEATEPDLLRFLHDVCALPGLFRVEEFKFTPDRNTGVIKGSMLITKVMRPAQGG